MLQVYVVNYSIYVPSVWNPTGLCCQLLYLCLICVECYRFVLSTTLSMPHLCGMLQVCVVNYSIYAPSVWNATGLCCQLLYLCPICVECYRFVLSTTLSMPHLCGMLQVCVVNYSIYAPSVWNATGLCCQLLYLCLICVCCQLLYLCLICVCCQLLYLCLICVCCQLLYLCVTVVDVQSIQSSCRQMSFECRRVSIESQISQLGISDMDDVYARPKKHKRKKHRENRVAPLAATASTTVETSHSQEMTQTRIVTAEVNSTNPGIWVTDRVERKASERVESRVSERKRSRKSERATVRDSEGYQASEIAGSWISEMTGSWASERAGNRASETIGSWASERVGNRASERASSRASERAGSRASGKRSERTGSRASSKASERTGSRASSKASERTGSRASSRASERTGSRASSRASEKTGSRASSRASERTGSRASSRASDRTWSRVSECNGSLAPERAVGRALERMPRRGPGSGFSDRTPCRVPERAVGCVSDRVGGRFPPPPVDIRGSYHRGSVTSVPSSPVSTLGSGVTTSGLSSLNTSAAPSVTVSLDVSSDDDDSSIENIILPDDRASTRVQPGPARLSATDLCSSYSPSFFGNNFLISGNFLRITSDSDVGDASTSKSKRWPLSLLHKRKKADQVVEIQLDQTLETST